MSRKKHGHKKALFISLSVIALLFAAMCGVTVTVMHNIFGRGDYPAQDSDPYNRYDPDWKKLHPREEVEFKSGENTLKGFIYGMENESPKGLLVFAHGISTGHESYMNQLMWFVEKGWRLFAYDATGSGWSEGKGTVGLVQSVIDLDKALTFAENDPRLAGLDIYLLGHSWGGFAVSAVQNFDHDIKASAEMSGYAYPLEMLDVGTIQTLKTKAAIVFHPFVWGYNKLVFKEYADLNAVDGINKSGIPNLLIHGENDNFVVYSEVSIVSKRDEITNPNAQFITLTGENADHNKFFNSDECNEYKKPFNERKKEIMENYKGKERDEKTAELTAEMDRTIVNTINNDLMQTIEDFYESAGAGR